MIKESDKTDTCKDEASAISCCIALKGTFQHSSIACSLRVHKKATTAHASISRELCPQCLKNWRVCDIDRAKTTGVSTDEAIREEDGRSPADGGDGGDRKCKILGVALGSTGILQKCIEIRSCIFSLDRALIDDADGVIRHIYLIGHL